MMRPEEIVIQVLRRWWIVLIAALVAGAVAYIGTSTEQETFTASAQVMAVAEPPDYYLDLYAKNRLASYKDIIRNWNFVDAALQSSGLDIDTGQALASLQLSHNPDANTVQITSVDSDPQRAADIANAVADHFVAWNKEQNANIVPQVEAVEERFAGRVVIMPVAVAGPPSKASGPRMRVNTFAGGLLGAVGGMVVVFILLYFDDTLKSAADLERYVGVPLLAKVPESEKSTG